MTRMRPSAIIHAVKHQERLPRQLCACKFLICDLASGAVDPLRHPNVRLEVVSKRGPKSGHAPSILKGLSQERACPKHFEGPDSKQPPSQVVARLPRGDPRSHVVTRFAPSHAVNPLPRGDTLRVSGYSNISSGVQLGIVLVQRSDGASST